ncbi:MAG: hypothetical protein NTX14_01425 [Candidatus Nealsonbacteria bacterium]|nr:hypothetical protein [Candidatus Nealsonbacteria bacterium]
MGEDVTVITKTDGGWSVSDQNRILRMGCYVINGHPMHPGVLILSGNWKQEELEKALGMDNFKRELTDSKDPKLPFKTTF